jgi:hypothetical protein
VDSNCDAGGRGQDVSSLQRRWKERCTSTAARWRFCQSGESFSATIPHWENGSEVCSVEARGACRIFLVSMQVLSRPVADDVDFHLAGRAAHQSGQCRRTGVRIELGGRNLPPLHETNDSTRDKKAERPPEINSKIQLHGHLKELKGTSRNCTRLCFSQVYGPPFVICVSLVNTYTLRTHCQAFGHTEGALGMQDVRRWNETCSRARLDRCHRCIGVARMRTLAWAPGCGIPDLCRDYARGTWKLACSKPGYL